MKDEIAPGCGKFAGGGAGGTELTAMERAWLQADAAGGDHSVPAQHRGRDADARAAERGNCVLSAAHPCALSMSKAERWTGCAMRWRRFLRRRLWRSRDVANRKKARWPREHGELVARAVKALRLQYNAGAGARSGACRSRRRCWGRAALRRRRGRCGICARISRRARSARNGGLRQAFSRPGRRHARHRTWRLRQIERTWRADVERGSGTLPRDCAAKCRW